MAQTRRKVNMLRTLTPILILTSFNLAFIGTAIFADEPDFEKLVALARLYECPVPPKDAELVWGKTTWSTQIEPSIHAPIYRPAFLLPSKKEESTKLLMGFGQTEIHSESAKQPATRPFSFDKPEPEKDLYSVSFEHLSCFETCLQLAMLGKNDVAKLLWSEFEKSKYISGGQPQEGIQAMRKNPEALLGLLIFKYYQSQTRNLDADGVKVATKLTELRKQFPKLFSTDKKEYYPFQRNEIVEGQIANMATAPPTEGSVEQSLLKWSQTKSKMRHLGYFNEHDPDADAAARDIFFRGTAAIPKLVSLLDDKRLSVHLFQGMNNAGDSQLSMGDLSQKLLIDILGATPIDRHAFVSNRKPYMEKWLKDNDLRDGAAFFLRAAIDPKTGQAYQIPMRILDKKHSEKMTELGELICNKVTKKTFVHYYTGTVRDSAMPLDKKTKLLTMMTEKLPPSQRRFPVQALAPINPTAATKLVMPMIEQLPTDVDEPYWTSEAANLTHIIMHLDDVEIWKKYLTATRKASVGLRMEMMNPVNYSYIKDKHKTYRLAYLAEFIDDKEVRDKQKNPKRFEGPCAGFTFQKLAVRDFVAMKLGSILLKMKERPDARWTEAQWRELRESVKSKLTEFDLPNLSHFGS